MHNGLLFLLLLKLLSSLCFLLSLLEDCLLLLEAGNRHPLAVLLLLQQPVAVERIGLVQDPLLTINLSLHLGDLLLHLRELRHLLLDLQLLTLLPELILLNLIFGASAFGCGLEQMERVTVIGTHGFAVQEELVYVSIQFNVLFLIDLDALMSCFYSLINPFLELVTKPGVQDIDEVLPAKFLYLLLAIREAHLNKWVLTN